MYKVLIYLGKQGATKGLQVASFFGEVAPWLHLLTGGDATCNLCPPARACARRVRARGTNR